MNKKAILGFVLVLILTLALAGLTFWKIAEVFGLYQTGKAERSFQDFANKIDSVAKKPVGTRESMPIYADEESAIIGFSAVSTEVYVLGAMDHHSPRPSECGAGACLCLCRHYDWDIEFSTVATYVPTWNVLPTRCRGEWNCRNSASFSSIFDFPSRLSEADYGLDFATEGGFIIARKWGKGDIEYRLKGVYITKERDGLVSVSFNTEGVSKDSIRQYELGKGAAFQYKQGVDAYSAKDYDTAIKKFDFLISKEELFKELTSGQRDAAYFLRGMAYYQKGDREKALKYLDEALGFVEDSELKTVIRGEIERIKKETEIKT